MDELDWTTDDLHELDGIVVIDWASPGEGFEASATWSGEEGVKQRPKWSVTLGERWRIDKTRHILAVGLAVLVAGLILVIAIWVADDTPNENADKVLIATMSSLVGLLGTAVGFYFSQHASKKGGQS